MTDWTLDTIETRMDEAKLRAKHSGRDAGRIAANTSLRLLVEYLADRVPPDEGEQAKRIAAVHDSF